VGVKLVVAVTVNAERLWFRATKLVQAPWFLNAAVPEPNLSVKVAVLEPATQRLAITLIFVCAP